MLLKRRDFLKVSSLATASLLVPRLLQATGKSIIDPTNKSNRVLVVLQLSGGNDGLNTVIPIGNDVYYKSRPALGIKPDKALALTDEVSLHPELKFFQSLYHDGGLGILNNVGYPEPDRSHFRSMDIWQTGSASKEVWQTGWIGRYLDHECKNCKLPTQAIEIDDSLSLALKGEVEKALALQNPGQLYQNSNQEYLRRLGKSYGNPLHDMAHEQPVDYLYKTMTGTLNSADYIYKESKAGNKSAGNYPKTQIGNNLKTIASLILADTNTQVYYVSVGSFDTHVNQDGQQAKLFRQINEAVEAFVTDLKANNKFDDVLLFTFSEFGRRVAQNASNGTDHGTANNMFFIGGGLKEKGLLNAMPDLGNLEQGDLKYQVDFKSVYATVLNNWLDADDEAILGKKMERLSFV
ncbi:MAG: DUF1501 domain-containing protein [Edaphocola sp.]